MIARPSGAFAVVLLVVGACSSSGLSPSPTLSTTSSPSPGTSTTTTVVSTEAIEAFRECLDQHGTKIEETSFDAQGLPRLDLVLIGLDFGAPETSTALTECADHLATGALSLEDMPEMQSLVVAALADFSECLRSQGVSDFPDPLPGFSGVGGPYPLAEIPYADPDLDSAAAVCRDRLG